uniref:Uncharacterized protein n=1 Tax=Anguilla anguilla TaxID=7936 RepID=A0A0E9XIM8_ANGAN
MFPEGFCNSDNLAKSTYSTLLYSAHFSTWYNFMKIEYIASVFKMIFYVLFFCILCLFLYHLNSYLKYTPCILVIIQIFHSCIHFSMFCFYFQLHESVSF